MLTQNGNALFLILIAVALFAALSYAITQSGRGYGNIESEQQMLDAAVMQQCQASVDYGMSRLKLLNNCPDDQISYELDDGTNESSDNPGDTSCFLFHEDGADITPCGIYTESLIETGTITEGDTDTIAVMPNGLYLSCPNWSGLGGDYARCIIQGSISGTSFTPDMVCINTGELSTLQGGIAVGDEMCNSMCGGTHDGGAFNGTSAVLDQATHAIQPDFSISTDTDSCNTSIPEIICDCW